MLQSITSCTLVFNLHVLLSARRSNRLDELCQGLNHHPSRSKRRKVKFQTLTPEIAYIGAPGVP